MEERRELRQPLLAGVQTEPPGDGEDELDDVPAVRPGVGVVRFDHVAEQVRRPLIGVLQLEHLVVLLLPLGRDARDDKHHREQEEQGFRVARRRERRQ